jgi:DNA-binding transcriptional MerR regulator
MGHNQPIRNSTHGSRTPLSEIPDKLYFRIGEVARLCEVPAYVLRFWESEFPQLKPNKGGTGQRLYRRRDVEMALRVKSLLKEEGYTIPGARQLLRAEFRLKEPQLSLLETGTSGSALSSCATCAASSRPSPPCSPSPSANPPPRREPRPTPPKPPPSTPCATPVAPPRRPTPRPPKSPSTSRISRPSGPSAILRALIAC